MKLSLHSPCTQKATISIFFFAQHSLWLWNGMGHAIRETIDERWCVHVLGEAIAITPNTQADLQNVARLGRDVEMCSGKKKAARHRKVQSRQSKSACIKHQLQPFPSRFRRTIRKFHACALCVFKRQARKKKKREKKAERIRGWLKLGSSALMMFSRYQYAHIWTRAFDSGDDDDDTVPLQ